MADSDLADGRLHSDVDVLELVSTAALELYLGLEIDRIVDRSLGEEPHGSELRAIAGDPVGIIDVGGVC